MTKDLAPKGVKRPTDKDVLVPPPVSQGSVIPTPELPYDAEKVRGNDVKPAPKPVKS